MVGDDREGSITFIVSKVAVTDGDSFAFFSVHPIKIIEKMDITPTVLYRLSK
jgi:hypothetical protein